MIAIYYNYIRVFMNLYMGLLKGMWRQYERAKNLAIRPGERMQFLVTFSKFRPHSLYPGNRFTDKTLTYLF